MEEKKLTDVLPLKKYKLAWNVVDEDHMAEDDQGEYIKLDDLEEFLQKLLKPQNLTKIIKAYTFGGKLDFKDLLE